MDIVKRMSSGEILDRMDIVTREALRAAETRSFGPMSFDPGPGLGRNCSPSAPPDAEESHLRLSISQRSKKGRQGRKGSQLLTSCPACATNSHNDCEAPSLDILVLRAGEFSPLQRFFLRHQDQDCNRSTRPEGRLQDEGRVLS